MREPKNALQIPKDPQTSCWESLL